MTSRSNQKSEEPPRHRAQATQDEIAFGILIVLFLLAGVVSFIGCMVSSL